MQEMIYVKENTSWKQNKTHLRLASAKHNTKTGILPHQGASSVNTIGTDLDHFIFSKDFLFPLL